jgi:prepilin-type N-terminal cleavage/methylation domain-containing protein
VRSWKNERGFTLLEVLLALVLLGLVLSLAQTRVSTAMSTVQLRNEAEFLAWVLRETRQQAISANQRQSVQFHIDTRSYSYLEGDEHLDRLLPEGVEFIEPLNLPTCTFNPTGAPSRGGHIGLKTAAKQMFVIINPAAGRVRVDSSPP